MTRAHRVLFDACTLENFASVAQLDLLEAQFSGRAARTDGVAFELRRRAAEQPALRPLVEAIWLGPPIVAEDAPAVQQIDRIRFTLRRPYPQSRYRDRVPAPRRPTAPRLPRQLLDGPGMLSDEGAYHGLAFADIDFTGRATEAVDISRCRFTNCDWTGGSLSGSKFSDCDFDRGSVANLRVERSSLHRVRFALLRVTGLHWIDGVLRDVLVSECRADLASFRFSDLRHVEFDRCDLTRADFTHANLTGVRFTRCDLTSAQFSQATMTGARLTSCVLSGVGGVASFAGAVVSRADLVELAPSMANALGIQVVDEE